MINIFIQDHLAQKQLIFSHKHIQNDESKCEFQSGTTKQKVQK